MHNAPARLVDLLRSVIFMPPTSSLDRRHLKLRRLLLLVDALLPHSSPFSPPYPSPSRSLLPLLRLTLPHRSLFAPSLFPMRDIETFSLSSPLQPFPSACLQMSPPLPSNPPCEPPSRRLPPSLPFTASPPPPSRHLPLLSSPLHFSPSSPFPSLFRPPRPHFIPAITKGRKDANKILSI